MQADSMNVPLKSGLLEMKPSRLRGLTPGRPSRPVNRAVAERLSKSGPQVEPNGNGSSNGVTTDIHNNQVVYGPTMNAEGNFRVSDLETVEPPSDEVQAILEERGYDLETSGLKYLSNTGRVCFSFSCFILLTTIGSFTSSSRGHIARRIDSSKKQAGFTPCTVYYVSQESPCMICTWKFSSL